MQRVIVYLLYKFGSNVPLGATGLAALIVAGLLLARSNAIFDGGYYRFVDHDEGRFAEAVSNDVFGDRFTEVKYLNQGWSAGESLWFYNTTQGSNMLPYDFFLALEQADSDQPFRAAERMNRYRYLPQKPSRSNPDGLPVGFVADYYLGKKYVGLTCAACHTSQVNYRGVGLRIDGGPGGADMDTFLKDLAAAMAATRDDAARRGRFIAAVLRHGNYGSEAEVTADLNLWALRLDAYVYFNESRDKTGNPVPYGYARLDAFGRIYNRVLQHLVTQENLEHLLGTQGGDQTGDLKKGLQDYIAGRANFGKSQKAHLFEGLLGVLKKQGRDDLRPVLREKFFNSPNAPVSYPFIWDIPQHDYVQWNGIVSNGGVGPLGRNTGEVIGVFATLDWAETSKYNLWRSLLARFGIGPGNVSFQSSVDSHNLRLLEDHIDTLLSPQWADASAKAGLPPIDQARKVRGAKLFDQFCESCHANIERDSPLRRVVAHMDAVDKIGTDGQMANNSVRYQGQSGILRNQYAKTGVGSVLLDTRAPVAALLGEAAENVVARPDPDKWFFTRGTDWAVNLWTDFKRNSIKASVKSGTYSPDTTASPFASLRAYKGRSLNGIWATAPYLHNGSVPTLYDLLLPAEPQPGDAADMQYRPKRFMVGSRELDTVKVGFKHGETEYDGFLFDTTRPSNSNAGHDGPQYGNRQMSPEDRLDLVEYLKSL